MKLAEMNYRVRQLVQSVKAAPLEAGDVDFIRDILNPEQAKLFFALPDYEKRHALRICRSLVQRGFGSDKELLQAALLHDIGKFDQESGRGVPIWGKVANVVLETVSQDKLAKKLARPEPDSWRFVFWLQAEHEKRGAELSRLAGSSERVAALIEKKSENNDPAAIALRQADDEN